jgi:hypothetical protein
MTIKSVQRSDLLWNPGKEALWGQTWGQRTSWSDRFGQTLTKPWSDRPRSDFSSNLCNTRYVVDFCDLVMWHCGNVVEVCRGGGSANFFSNCDECDIGCGWEGPRPKKSTWSRDLFYGSPLNRTGGFETSVQVWFLVCMSVDASVDFTCSKSYPTPLLSISLNSFFFFLSTRSERTFLNSFKPHFKIDWSHCHHTRWCNDRHTPAFRPDAFLMLFPDRNIRSRRKATNLRVHPKTQERSPQRIENSRNRAQKNLFQKNHSSHQANCKMSGWWSKINIFLSLYSLWLCLPCHFGRAGNRLHSAHIAVSGSRKLCQCCLNNVFTKE